MEVEEVVKSQEEKEEVVEFQEEKEEGGEKEVLFQ
jgi:hypothetical protein